MDAILTDSHLDTVDRIKICIIMNVIVPKIKYAGEACEGNAKLVRQLETVLTAAIKALRCSSTTSTTAVLREELGVYPRSTNRDVRKLKWRNNVSNKKRRLQAKADRAVWEKK